MKYLIHNIIFYILFIPVSIFFSVLCAAVGYLEKDGRMCNRGARLWGKIVNSISGMPLTVEMPDLDPGKAYIFMVNHQSQLDIPIVMTVFNRFYFGFLAKESLFKIPFFGNAMEMGGHISVDRENRRKAMQSIDRAIENTRRGMSILIFPEGTRHAELSDFRIGGIILAMKTGLPIVPVVIAGSGEALPKGSLFLKPRPILIRALPPIDVASQYTLKDRDKFKEHIWQIMYNALAETKPWLDKTRP